MRDFRYFLGLIAFNSLYEIQEQAYQEGFSRRVLSILSMRFFETMSLEMKIDFEKAFNSLYEIQPNETARKTDWNLKLSILSMRFK